MENRLKLNKRPTYELPDDVVIGEYIKRPDVRRCKTPNFESDICLNSKYNIKVSDKGNAKDQIWIKTKNKDLIDFIKHYNWKLKAVGVTTKSLSLSMFKKILLEEFYGVKYGE